MTDEMPSDVESSEVSYPVDMRPTDVALIRTALRVRLSTLGREEAEEVEEVNALLARLPDVRAGDDLP